MTAGHGQRLEVGDVVLAGSGTAPTTWWLIDGPEAQSGENAVLVHGPVPRFPDGREFENGRTHWSDQVVKDQLAIINPPAAHWPDEVCVALATFKLTGKAVTDGE